MGEVTTAYHEAGHVIMANVINWQYKDVTVVPGESCLGKIALESPPPDILEALACSSFLPWQRKWLAQKILLCVAGMVAERIAGFINEDDYWNVETGFAVDLAVEGGLWIEYEASGDSLFKADVPAERLLRRHWPEVEMVAKALLERKTLTSNEVDALVFGRK